MKLSSDTPKFNTAEQPMTSSGIPIQLVYTAEDVDLYPEKKLGKPGEYPFGRGIYPDMYRGKLWTIRQYAGYGTARESNQRFKYLIGQGQTGLSIAFDLPTQIGYDPDHTLARGEVGKTGVSICSLADMEILTDGIPLDQVSTSMTINATALILLALYVAVAKKRGIAPDKLAGTVQNDILKEFIARGTYIFPPKPSLRLVTSIFLYARDHLPNWNTISVSGYHIREAGATAVQEVAFTLADAMEYVKTALNSGLQIDEFAPRLSFFFSAHADLFEEIAKFRAARRLWAKIMKERLGAKNPDSWKLRFHTQTAGSTLTAQQSENNIIRTTLQALAAVLGGTQSLHTNAFDEARTLPSEKSVELALRTQQIIAYESNVAATVDPLGGSYFVESLTDSIETETEKYLEKIDQLGGALACVENGFFKKEIQKSAYEFQKCVEADKRTIVGVNRFVTAREEPCSILKVDLRVQEEQIKNVRKIRLNRDNASAEKSRLRLKSAAGGTGSLFEPILECVENYVTVGEICETLRNVWGEYREQVLW